MSNSREVGVRGIVRREVHEVADRTVRCTCIHTASDEVAGGVVEFQAGTEAAIQIDRDGCRLAVLEIEAIPVVIIAPGEAERRRTFAGGIRQRNEDRLQVVCRVHLVIIRPDDIFRFVHRVKI